jgi:hypothetical protein
VERHDGVPRASSASPLGADGGWGRKSR